MMTILVQLVLKMARFMVVSMALVAMILTNN